MGVCGCMSVCVYAPGGECKHMAVAAVISIIPALCSPPSLFHPADWSSASLQRSSTLKTTACNSQHVTVTFATINTPREKVAYVLEQGCQTYSPRDRTVQPWSLTFLPVFFSLLFLSSLLSIFLSVCPHEIKCFRGLVFIPALNFVLPTFVE